MLQVVFSLSCVRCWACNEHGVNNFTLNEVGLWFTLALTASLFLRNVRLETITAIIMTDIASPFQKVGVCMSKGIKS